MAILSKKDTKLITDPLADNNPITIQVLGICSALAITAELKASLVMGIAVLFVLGVGNVVISLLRNLIPSKIRIIVQLIVVASLVIIVVVSSRLATFDMSLEEAALDLGSTPFEAFRLVTLPIIAPAVISGWLLAFTLSLDDLVIASFTSGPSATTLPIKIFSAVRLGVSPEINALSTIMIAIVTIGVISASLISKRAAVRQRLEEQQAVRS